MGLKNYLKDKDERNLIYNIILAFMVKGVSMVLSLFSMPLYIKYFNNDDVLGLWYTILSLLNWILICDLGLGNGLRNRLTEALARGDTEKAKKCISSTYGILIVVILPVAIVGVVLFRFLDFNSFFNISSSTLSPQTFCVVVSVLFLGVCASFVLKLINVIIYAIQKSSLNNILTLITSAIPLVYIFFFDGGKNTEQNLLTLTVVHVISINLPLIISTLILFRSKMLKDCRPSVKCFDFSTSINMFGFGFQFFLAQVTFMFLTNTNEIMITKLYSSADVVNYSVYYRLFTVVGSLFMLALTPLWSKVTKDLALKKYRKILKTNKVLYAVASITFLCEFLMVPLAQYLVNFWLQEEAIVIDYLTAACFAFYGGVYIFNVVLTTVANGMGDLRTQIVFYGTGSVIKIPVIYALSLSIKSWSVVVFYNAVVLLVFCAFQFVWIQRKLNKLCSAPSVEET